jgi:hypothetical protein
MNRTLTSFIWVWITLILIVNLFGIVGGTWNATTKMCEEKKM